MKFNTPRCPRLFRGFPLLEKGGLSLGGMPHPQSWLPYAPLGASLADRNGLTLVEGVGYATRFGKVTAARITFHASFIIASRYSFIAER